MDKDFAKEFCSVPVGVRNQKRWTATIGCEHTQPRCAYSFCQILVEHSGIQRFLQTEGFQHGRVDPLPALTVLIFGIGFRLEADSFLQPLDALRSGNGIDAQIVQDRVCFRTGCFAPDGTADTAAYLFFIRGKGMGAQSDEPLFAFFSGFVLIIDGNRFASGDSNGLQFLLSQNGTQSRPARCPVIIDDCGGRNQFFSRRTDAE